MASLTDISTIPGAIPDGYHQVLDWKITQNRKHLLVLNLVSIPWLAVCAGLFTLWKMAWDTLRDLGLIGSGASTAASAGSRLFVVANWTVAILAGVAVMVVLHELVHGLTMRCFGARPTYGVLWSGLMFYATADGFAFQRNQYIKVALAPFIVLGLLVMFILAWPVPTKLATLLIICGAFNCAGAIGDLWITRIVLKYSSRAYVIDERDGVRIFMPEEAA